MSTYLFYWASKEVPKKIVNFNQSEIGDGSSTRLVPSSGISIFALDTIVDKLKAF